MWSLREQGLLTVHESDLYLYLVHRCNRLGWKNPFMQPTDITCAVLGINRNALVSRRNKLQQLGLIGFKEGERKTKPPVYILCSVKEVQSYAQLAIPVDMHLTALPEIVNQNNTKQNKTPYENKREVDYQLVISTFNEICKSLPKVGKLTGQRRQKLNAVARHIGIDKLLECFRLVEESHLMSGRQGKWRATFDWIIEPDNMLKILEGEYSYDNTSTSSAYHSSAAAKQYGTDKWAEVAAQITDKQA